MGTAQNLKIRKQTPKIAAAPVLESFGQVVTTIEALMSLWVRQFKAEFAGKK